MKNWEPSGQQATWNVGIEWFRLLESQVRVPLPSCRNKLICTVSLSGNDYSPLPGYKSDDEMEDNFVYRHYAAVVRYQGHQSASRVEIVIRKSLPANNEDLKNGNGAGGVNGGKAKNYPVVGSMSDEAKLGNRGSGVGVDDYLWNGDASSDEFADEKTSNGTISEKAAAMITGAQESLGTPWIIVLSLLSTLLSSSLIYWCCVRRRRATVRHGTRVKVWANEPLGQRLSRRIHSAVHPTERLSGGYIPVPSQAPEYAAIKRNHSNVVGLGGSDEDDEVFSTSTRAILPSGVSGRRSVREKKSSVFRDISGAAKKYSERTSSVLGIKSANLPEKRKSSFGIRKAGSGRSKAGSKSLLSKWWNELRKRFIAFIMLCCCVGDNNDLGVTFDGGKGKKKRRGKKKKKKKSLFASMGPSPLGDTGSEGPGFESGPSDEAPVVGRDPETHETCAVQEKTSVHVVNEASPQLVAGKSSSSTFKSSPSSSSSTSATYIPHCGAGNQLGAPSGPSFLDQRMDVVAGSSTKRPRKCGIPITRCIHNPGSKCSLRCIQRQPGSPVVVAPLTSSDSSSTLSVREQQRSSSSSTPGDVGAARERPGGVDLMSVGDGAHSLGRATTSQGTSNVLSRTRENLIRENQRMEELLRAWERRPASCTDINLVTSRRQLYANTSRQLSSLPDRMLSPTDNRLLSTSQQRLHSRRGRRIRTRNVCSSSSSSTATKECTKSTSVLAKQKSCKEKPSTSAALQTLFSSLPAQNETHALSSSTTESTNKLTSPTSPSENDDILTVEDIAPFTSAGITILPPRGEASMASWVRREVKKGGQDVAACKPTNRVSFRDQMETVSFHTRVTRAFMDSDDEDNNSVNSEASAEFWKYTRPR